MTNNNNKEENNSNHHQHQEPEWLVKYLKHQGDWLEKTRGNLMVAATVIASMSFQVMVNPPGGVWQEDYKCSAQNQTGLESGCVEKAGTSILQFYQPKRIAYIAMLISSTMSFSASMSLIPLVILGLRLRNRLVMAILVFFMVVAVMGMVSAFIYAVALVHSLEDMAIIKIIAYYVLFWISLPCVIVLCKFIQLLVWVICKICCGRSRRSRSRLPSVISTTDPVSEA